MTTTTPNFSALNTSLINEDDTVQKTALAKLFEFNAFPFQADTIQPPETTLTRPSDLNTQPFRDGENDISLFNLAPEAPLPTTSGFYNGIEWGIGSPGSFAGNTNLAFIANEIPLEEWDQIGLTPGPTDGPLISITARLSPESSAVSFAPSGGDYIQTSFICKARQTNDTQGAAQQGINRVLWLANVPGGPRITNQWIKPPGTDRRRYVAENMIIGNSNDPNYGDADYPAVDRINVVQVSENEYSRLIQNPDEFHALQTKDGGQAIVVVGRTYYLNVTSGEVFGVGSGVGATLEQFESIVQMPSDYNPLDQWEDVMDNVAPSQWNVKYPVFVNQWGWDEEIGPTKSGWEKSGDFDNVGQYLTSASSKSLLVPAQSLVSFKAYTGSSPSIHRLVSGHVAMSPGAQKLAAWFSFEEGGAPISSIFTIGQDGSYQLGGDPRDNVSYPNSAGFAPNMGNDTMSMAFAAGVPNYLLEEVAAINPVFVGHSWNLPLNKYVWLNIYNYGLAYTGIRGSEQIDVYSQSIPSQDLITSGITSNTLPELPQIGQQFNYLRSVEFMYDQAIQVSMFKGTLYSARVDAIQVAAGGSLSFAKKSDTPTSEANVKVWFTRGAPSTNDVVGEQGGIPNDTAAYSLNKTADTLYWKNLILDQAGSFTPQSDPYNVGNEKWFINFCMTEESWQADNYEFFLARIV